MVVRRKTRKDIMDMMSVENIPWWGRLDEVGFLGRLFDLNDMPSHDHRLMNAEQDIRQHRQTFSDWPDEWVFTDERFDLLGCEDELFLDFLAELVHPVVRPEPTESARLVKLINPILRRDGFELAERSMLGERPVWSAREISLANAAETARMSAVRAAHGVFDADSIRHQLTRMEASIESDPSLAIGTAKELIESTCKAILEERGRTPSGTADLPKLVRTTSDELGLVPENVTDSTEASIALRRMLGSLSTLAGSIGQLRNSHGTGHGKAPSYTGLPPRHARLVVAAASALAVFLWQTHLDVARKSEISRG